MAFTHALSNAISGMNAAQAQIQVHANNIANAATPGYARREANLVAGALGGVRVGSVERAGDDLLRAERLSADARSSDQTIRSEAAAGLNRIFGEPGDATGLFAALSRFDTAIDDLATTPESPAYQGAALTAAEDLARTFNRIGMDVTGLRSNADRQIAATVDQVNTALQGLAELNKASARTGATGLSDLEEQRALFIDQVAEALDIVVSTGPRGGTQIRTAEGVILLGDRPHLIEFSKGGVVTADIRFEDGELSGLSVDGIDLTPAGGPQGTRAGSLAGQFAVRDRIAPDFIDRIDAIADDLISRFSDPATDGTLGGGDGVFTANAGGQGVATRIGVNAALDPDQGGTLYRWRDGVGAVAPGASTGAGVTAGLQGALDRATVLSSATDTPAALSAADIIAATSSVVGTKTIEAASNAAAASATARALGEEEFAATGVSTDAELQRLLLIEQAYAANARVVQVVSDMMARLMEI